jgi:pilus assembly protein TadC
MEVPILLLPLDFIEKAGRRTRWLGKFLFALRPSLRGELPKIGIKIDAESYCVGSLLSSLAYGLIFFLVSMISFTIRGVDEQALWVNSTVIGSMFWLLFFVLHILYPNILVKKIAAKQSKDLLFALREIMMDVSGGVPLFHALKNVSESDYGKVASEFEWVIKQIEGGMSEQEALKLLAIKSENEFMKRAVWQLLNALESGASVKDALPSIIEALESALYHEIRLYSSNLNFLMLMYMFAAAVLPAIGVTFLALLSAFGGIGVEMETIIMLVAMSVMLQTIMIGYMSVTRPAIFGG